MINIIAAMDKNRGIGKGGKLPWNIPEDLKRFREITAGHPVIMGRKTWESIPPKFRPLPNRENIVITRNPEYEADEATVLTSLESAIECAKKLEGGENVFIIGGGEIYKQALPCTDKLYLTLVDKEVDADTFFPDYSEFKKEIENVDKIFEDIKYKFVTLER